MATLRVSTVEDRLSFKDGLLATAPLAPGVIAFGLLYGMMARQAGLSPIEALAMSLMVHAGSAQFAVIGMWTSSHWAAIILTTLIINLRHLLMGASIAPYLKGLSNLQKAALSLWISDESYALAISAYQNGRGSHGYFFGVNLGIYLVWPLSGLVGGLAGTAIPDPARFGLDLIFPLAFLGLLVSFLKGWPDVVVALAAAGIALAGVLWLPGKWYVILAGLLGSLIGVLVEEGVKRWKTS